MILLFAIILHFLNFLQFLYPVFVCFQLFLHFISIVSDFLFFQINFLVSVSLSYLFYFFSVLIFFTSTYCNFLVFIFDHILLCLVSIFFFFPLSYHLIFLPHPNACFIFFSHIFAFIFQGLILRPLFFIFLLLLLSFHLSSLFNFLLIFFIFPLNVCSVAAILFGCTYILL